MILTKNLFFEFRLLVRIYLIGHVHRSSLQAVHLIKDSVISFLKINAAVKYQLIVWIDISRISTFKFINFSNGARYMDK